MSHYSFYLENENYTEFLERQKETDFHKYVEFINKLSTYHTSKFLDIGCGSGIALTLLKNNIDGYGIEISRTSVDLCKDKNLNVVRYNGKEIPYSNDLFDIVGSFNVLEHTEDAVNFLNEKYRVTKKGGYILVVCPSFLSVTNNFYRTTKGLKNKIRNIFELVAKSVKPYKSFEYMPPVVNEKFTPDDDAICKTNPSDILNWGKSKNMKLVYWSGCSSNLEGIKHTLDFFPLKLFLGSSFIVFKK